jgi:hypothetical protein
METPLPPVEPAISKNNQMALIAGILGLGSIAVALLGLLVSLVLPAAFLIFCGLGLLMDLVALVLGIIGLVQLKNHPEQKGKGLAITGIVFGGLAVVLLCLSPVIITAVLALLGPVIGNVFSQVNNSIVP